MPTTANKIKYGLSKCYYAVATIAADGSATYGTPVALPGAVSLTLDPAGDNTVFYADNIKYWIGENNNGYTGSLELALIPESFKHDCMGVMTNTDDKTLLEVIQANSHPFALMFQFEGDVKATRHVFFNCAATRPSVAGSTKNDSLEPQTETINLEVGSIYDSSFQKDMVKSSTTEDTPDAVYNNWFTSVYTG